MADSGNCKTHVIYKRCTLNTLAPTCRDSKYYSIGVVTLTDNRTELKVCVLEM